MFHLKGAHLGFSPTGAFSKGCFAFTPVFFPHVCGPTILAKILSEVRAVSRWHHQALGGNYRPSCSSPCNFWCPVYVHCKSFTLDQIRETWQCAIDASDSGGGEGADCCTANLFCTVEEPVIHNTTDDVCYAVDVCNLFSSLPVKYVLMVESGVKDFLLRLIIIP